LNFGRQTLLFLKNKKIIWKIDENFVKFYKNFMTFYENFKLTGKNILHKVVAVTLHKGIESLPQIRMFKSV